MDLWLQGSVAARIEHPYTRGSIEFVRRDAEQIDIQSLNIEREHADRLHGITMKEHTSLTADRAKLGDRLDRTDLVVRIHNRDKDCVWAKGGAQIVGMHHTCRINRE